MNGRFYILNTHALLSIQMAAVVCPCVCVCVMSECQVAKALFSYNAMMVCFVNDKISLLEQDDTLFPDDYRVHGLCVIYLRLYLV